MVRLQISNRDRARDRRDKVFDKRDELQEKLDGLTDDANDKQRVRLRRRIAERESRGDLLTLRLEKWPETDERILPTRLGNLLRHYEDQANDLLRSTRVDGAPWALQSLEDLLPLAHFAIPPSTREQHDRFIALVLR